jgi:hypothetical protein
VSGSPRAVLTNMANSGLRANSEVSHVQNSYATHCVAANAIFYSYLGMAERVGFVPAVPAPINDLGMLRGSQITKSTQNLSIRYKTGTAQTAS